MYFLYCIYIKNIIFSTSVIYNLIEIYIVNFYFLYMIFLLVCGAAISYFEDYIILSFRQLRYSYCTIISTIMP